MTKESYIRKHYRFLNHEYTTELRLFGQDIPKNESKIFIVENEEDFVETVKKYDNYHIGVGINERDGKGIEDKNVISVKTIVIDVDTQDEDQISKIENKLSQNNLEYAAKINSGKGYHYYFNCEKFDNQISETMDKIKQFFIYDLELPIDRKCFNPSRIFRVWGSNNEDKQVELLYYEPDARVLELNEIISEKTYEDQQSQLVNQRSYLGKRVVDKFPLFDEIQQNPKIFPINVSGTQFNDVILKNAAAYIKEKEIKNLKPWYTLAKNKGHPPEEIDRWLKKDLSFNPFEVMNNIRTNYPELYRIYCAPMINELPQHSVLYINEGENNWRELKNQYRETNSFVINRKTQIVGNLRAARSCKSVLRLSRNYQGITDPTYVTKIYFDEQGFQKGLTKKQKEESDLQYLGDTQGSFYKYEFITDSNFQITVFSEAALESGRYRLYGTLIDLDETEMIGNQSKLTAVDKVLILHSYNDLDLKFDNIEDTYNNINVSGDELYKYLMTDVQDPNSPVRYFTPRFYQDMYMSFIFSGPARRGEKINYIIFGPTGTGKTPQMETLVRKFGESQTYTGGSMTVKGLTVSFWNEKSPKPGALLETQRICGIDELFKIFNRMKDYSEITMLNDYLDNQNISAVSGKININVRPTSKVLAVTNPIMTTNTTVGQRNKLSLIDILKFIDPDFWGRFIIINQNRKDEDWVKDPNNIEYNVTINADLTTEKMKSLYDYYSSFSLMSRIDRRKLDQISEGINIPEDLESVYKKMCNKNLSILFDGFVKWKRFCEKSKLEVYEQDYKDFTYLWNTIFERWFEEDNMLDIVPLNTLEKEALRILNDEKSFKAKQLKKELEDLKHFNIINCVYHSPEDVLNNLVNRGLIAYYKQKAEYHLVDKDDMQFDNMCFYNEIINTLPKKERFTDRKLNKKLKKLIKEEKIQYSHDNLENIKQYLISKKIMKYFTQTEEYECIVNNEYCKNDGHYHLQRLGDKLLRYINKVDHRPQKSAKIFMDRLDSFSILPLLHYEFKDIMNYLVDKEYVIKDNGKRTLTINPDAGLNFYIRDLEDEIPKAIKNYQEGVDKNTLKIIFEDLTNQEDVEDVEVGFERYLEYLLYKILLKYDKNTEKYYPVN